MSKSRPKRAVRRWGKHFPNGSVADKSDAVLPSAAPLSLPPTDAGHTLPVPIEPQKCTKCGTLFLKRQDVCNICGEWSPSKQLIPEGMRKADDSPMRVIALKIVAMREAGVSEDGIASELGLAKSSISSYIHKAGKNGWLDFADPKNQLEYQLMHKVVRNLDEALDDGTRHITSGVMVRTAVAQQIAEGALYPRLAGQQVAVASTLIGVKIEVVGNAGGGVVREGTVLGTPSYVEADPVE